MILRLRFLLCWILIVQFTCGVDFDYYFSALRSDKVCTNMTQKLKCQIRCDQDIGMCMGDECYCLTVRRAKKYGIEGSRNKNKYPQRYADFHEYNELPVLQYGRRNADSLHNNPEYLGESLLYNKPMLRHHIAHFCPNLDVARKCIRTCMKEGKPAFCGKDHVCYCGHKYSDHDINSDVNASSVYAQFKDMYKKYFGPNYKPEIQA